MSDARFSFSGRSAIVTGGARGIGLEIVRLLADGGAHVFVVDNDAEALARATESVLGATPLPGDVSSTDDVERITADVINATGRIDILVNNAGVLRDRMLWKMTDADWDLVLAVHLGGTFKFTRACTPHFRSRSYGRVVNVTSYSGLRGNVGQANYSAAKAGIIGLTKTSAKELARFGVTVNAVSPNALTRMLDDIPEADREQFAQAIPAGRFAEPREIAPAVAFLVSEVAGYITGVVLPVDGGASV